MQDEHVDPLQHIHLTRLNTDEARRFLNDEFGLNIELGIVSADLRGNSVAGHQHIHLTGNESFIPVVAKAPDKKGA